MGENYAEYWLSFEIFLNDFWTELPFVTDVFTML